MLRPVFYRAGTTEACEMAAEVLINQGILFADSPGQEVTDLLLDVPSFQEKGILRSGESLSPLLSLLPGLRHIYGGKLPELPCQAHDLLEDPSYLAENAAITADCAIRLCSLSLKTSWQDSRVLVIGWGRIGKQLCRMLRALGTQVTVCARKAPDRALLAAFSYKAISPDALNGNGYQVIFNTAPDLKLDSESLGDCPIPMDLSSGNGLQGTHVIKARGLPGIYAPITSGKLIAETILKNWGGEYSWISDSP